LEVTHINLIIAGQVWPYNGPKPRLSNVTYSNTDGTPWSPPTGSKTFNLEESKVKHFIVNHFP